jgi:hypothetical protein
MFDAAPVFKGFSIRKNAKHPFAVGPVHTKSALARPDSAPFLNREPPRPHRRGDDKGGADFLQPF